MGRGTVTQHCAIVLPNVGIAHISGIISVRVIKRILPKIKVARQDNITHDGTCPGRIKGGEGHAHTHTHPRH